MILLKFMREKGDCDWLSLLRNKDEEILYKNKKPTSLKWVFEERD